MELIGEVDFSGRLPLERFAVVTRRSAGQVLLRGGRGVIRRLISITPPASALGVAGGLDSGSEAKQRGFASIRRDLNHAFAPVRLKGQRKEMIPAAELARIHARLLAKKRPGKPMKRDRAQPYYVDVRKLRQHETTLRSHVGRLAAGWAPAAVQLGVPMPQWVARHGTGNGTYRAQLDGSLIYIEAVNLTSAHAPSQELRRRVGYAVDYQANAMNREMQFLLKRDAVQVGLKAG